MKIYIAGSFNIAPQIHEHAETLEEMGHIITGVWFQAHDPIEKLWDSNFGGRIAEVMALRDLDGIRRAEVVIIDATSPSLTGGYHSELGYALALDKRIILIGEATNIFMSLVREFYLTWENLYETSGI